MLRVQGAGPHLRAGAAGAAGRGDHERPAVGLQRPHAGHWRPGQHQQRAGGGRGEAPWRSLPARHGRTRTHATCRHGCAHAIWLHAWMHAWGLWHGRGAHAPACNRLPDGLSGERGRTACSPCHPYAPFAALRPSREARAKGHQLQELCAHLLSACGAFPSMRIEPRLELCPCPACHRTRCMSPRVCPNLA